MLTCLYWMETEEQSGSSQSGQESDVGVFHQSFNVLFRDIDVYTTPMMSWRQEYQYSQFMNRRWQLPGHHTRARANTMYDKLPRIL